MLKKHVISAALNFSTTVFLLLLIATPFYFAKNINKIAGVKTESPYLLVSQTEKFPSMTFSQSQNRYTISFTKQAQKQAYLSILIINNPSKTNKTYTINKSSYENSVFFGEDLNNQRKTVTLPPQSSSPMSLISENLSLSGNVEFLIELD